MRLRKAAIALAASVAIVGSSGLAFVGLSGVAGANGTTGPASGASVPVVIPTNPDPTSGNPIVSGTPFESGQTIEVNIPPNQALNTTEKIEIIECADPGGLVANLPTTVTNCDTSTKQGDTIIPNDDGSYDYFANDPNGDGGYQVAALPKAGTTGTVTCGSAAVPCVLWIGNSYSSFLTNQLWSQPFQVVAAGPNVQPGDGTPEVPLAIGLPIAAAGIFAGGLALRRRRAAKANAA